jgi:opacity protein-like surface antigen
MLCFGKTAGGMGRGGQLLTPMKDLDYVRFFWSPKKTGGAFPVLRWFLFVICGALFGAQAWGITVTTAQVVIDTKFADVSTTISRQIIDGLPTTKRNVNELVTVLPPVDTSRLIGRLNRTPNFILNGLPTITTLPNQPATIKTGGIGLELLPTVGENGYINLQVKPIAPHFEPIRYKIQPGHTFLYDQKITAPDGTRHDRLFFFTPQFNAPAGNTPYSRVVIPPRGPSIFARPLDSSYSKFEFGAGYSYMRTDQEMVKDLNGFNTSIFYNVNPWLALGSEFDALCGCEAEESSTGVRTRTELERYTYMFGGRVSVRPVERVRLYGQLMFGGATDCNEQRVRFQEFNFSDKSSATAFAMSVGLGADVKICPRFSFGPEFNYVPTHFSSNNSDTSDWQHNWRFSVDGRLHF